MRSPGRTSSPGLRGRLPPTPRSPDRAHVGRTVRVTSYASEQRDEYADLLRSVRGRARPTNEEYVRMVAHIK